MGKTIRSGKSAFSASKGNEYAVAHKPGAPSSTRPNGNRVSDKAPNAKTSKTYPKSSWNHG